MAADKAVVLLTNRSSALSVTTLFLSLPLHLPLSLDDLSFVAFFSCTHSKSHGPRKLVTLLTAVSKLRSPDEFP